MPLHKDDFELTSEIVSPDNALVLECKFNFPAKVLAKVEFGFSGLLLQDIFLPQPHSNPQNLSPTRHGQCPLTFLVPLLLQWFLQQQAVLSMFNMPPGCVSCFFVYVFNVRNYQFDTLCTCYSNLQDKEKYLILLCLRGIICIHFAEYIKPKRR